MLETARGSTPIPPPPPRFKEADWVTVPNGAPRHPFCQQPQMQSMHVMTSSSSPVFLPASGISYGGLFAGSSGTAISPMGDPAATCEPPHVIRILDVDMRRPGRYRIRTHGGIDRILLPHEFDALEDWGRAATEDEVNTAALKRVTKEDEEEQ